MAELHCCAGQQKRSLESTCGPHVLQLQCLIPGCLRRGNTETVKLDRAGALEQQSMTTSEMAVLKQHTSGPVKRSISRSD